MSEIEITDPFETTGRTLGALRLAEEKACGGYLDARKAEVRLGARVVSLHRLIVEQPRRSDYRTALTALIERYQDAKDRTRLAYACLMRARDRYDLVWQDTEGRRPRLSTVPSAESAVPAGQVA